MTALLIVLYAIAGTLVGSILCLVPSLHIYNVMGIALLCWYQFGGLFPYEAIAPFFMSMMVAFAFINTIPMTFFSAADESAGATILPTLDMLMSGKGRDASLMTGVGVLWGAVLLAILTPVFFTLWPYVYKICRAHLHWVIGLILVFYVMSEWPKGAGRGKTVFAKFRDAWRNIAAGLATFALSAVVGLIVTSKPLAPPELSFQNIMPVFLGFFAFPSLLQALFSEVPFPEQHRSKHINMSWGDLGAATLPGIVGGLMTMTIPAVTIGIAAIFSSHYTNHRALRPVTLEKPREPGLAVYVHTPEIYYQAERTFVIAGGIMKMLYYVGAFLLLFVSTEIVPNGMGRGGLNILLKPIFSPEKGDYAVMMGTILFASSLSMLLLVYLTDAAIWIVPKLNLKTVNLVIAAMLVLILYFMGGGWTAILIASVTTCIGCIPVFYNCRRSHCMAVLLVPIMLSSSGHADAITKAMGLI